MMTFASLQARAFGYVLPPQSRNSSSLEEGGNTYEVQIVSLLFHGNGEPHIWMTTAFCAFQGGAVLEPDTGFYDEPVVTLDFASLYPSIMQLLDMRCGKAPMMGPQMRDLYGRKCGELPYSSSILCL